MSLNYQAYSFLMAFFNGEDLPEGLSLRAKLQELELDFSLHSLQRLDVLLSKIRPQLKLSLEQFVTKPANFNFLQLLNFYLGETVRRQTDATLNWLEFDEFAAAWPSLAQQGRRFDYSAICFFNCTARTLGTPMLSLQAIVRRMFVDDSLSVLEVVQRTIDELTRNAMQLLISPEACLQTLPQEEWIYPEVPVPAWAWCDPLRRSLDQCKYLWRGGKVVWGRVVQAKNEIYGPGQASVIGQVIYDAHGGMDYTALIAPSNALLALHTQNQLSAEFASLKVYLSGGWVRAFGFPLPNSLCSHNTPAKPRIVLSTILFHRPHLAHGRLSLPYFPLLINDRYPGTVMVLPSRWWPQELLQRWHFQSQSE